MSTTPPRLAALFSFILAFLLSMPLHAQNGNEANLDQEQLKQEIVEQVIEEMRDSGVLQEAVQEGIREFIVQQQQAQQRQRQQADEQAKNVRPVSAERDHIYGNPDATISLIEYSDFECPYCKRFHPTAKELVDASDGEINWVYRHFPLDFHNPGAQKQAEASECAAELGGDDKFWAYTDALYERTASGGRGFPLDQLVPLAAELGMDEAAFEECVESGRHENRIKEDISEGIRAGINGTPGNILLNNKTGETLMRAGAQPLEVLEEATAILKESKGQDS